MTKNNLIQKYAVFKNLFISRITDQYYVCFNPLSNKKVVVLNRDILRLIIYLNFPKTLKQIRRQFPQWDKIYLINSLRNLQLFSLISYGNKIDSIIFKPNTNLEIWFSLTNECNLRCRYCFVEKGNLTMSWSVAKKAVEVIFSTAEKNHRDSITMKFGGGEPTLHFDLVKKISEYAILLNKHYHKKLKFILVSNGVTFNDNIIKFIKKNNFIVSLSTDGVGKWHDKQRIFPDGSGSFEYVEKTIDKLISNGIFPRLSAVITSENCAGLAVFVKYVLQNNLSFKFALYKENELSVDDKQLSLRNQKIIKGLKNAYKVIRNYLIQRSRIKEKLPPYYLDSLLDQTQFISAHKHSCGAGINYFTIDPLGQISVCAHRKDTVFDKVTNSDFINKYVQSEKKLRTGLRNISVEDKEVCKDCKWKYWCAGGCPSSTYWSYKTNSAHSPFCPIFKAMIPEYLKLEGYRILSEKKLL